MKLYYTPNSPYARITRVAARKSGLIAGIEEIAVVTREAGTGYFEVTPLARVPVLVDGDVTLADTRDICARFDEISEQVRWCPAEDHEARFMRHVVVGFLDGVAVWLRENGRPDGQRSEPVMRYEEHRARQVLTWLEPRWAHEQRDFAALALACAVAIAVDRGMGVDWHSVAPGLKRWAENRASECAMQETAPLPI